MSRRLVQVGPALLLSLATLAACAGCGTQVGIAASPADIYVEVGGTATVHVVAVMSSGSPQAESKPLTVTSGDAAVVTASGTNVTGVAEGTATLSISDGTFSTTAVVHVVAQGTLPTDLVVTPISISCNPASGDTQLHVFAVLSTGASVDVTATATYRSSDTHVALVTAAGVVVCVSQGQAAVTTEYLGASDIVQVVVQAVPPTALAFSPPTLTCLVGEVRQVQVLATWQDGARTDVTSSASYASSDDAVAFASLGQVQCLSEGSAAVTAQLSGVTSVLNVTVQAGTPTPAELVGLHVDPPSVDCGLTQAAGFAVFAELSDGTTVDVTGNAQTQYASSDSTVALVFQGQVICIQAGQAIIQVTYGGLAANVTVNVQ